MGTKSPAWVRWLQTMLASLLFMGALTLLVFVVFGVAPLFMGLHPFVVLSGSMEPTIHTGSIVLSQTTTPTELQAGDVIAFNPRAEAALPVVHRIVTIEERNGTRYATTRGDANTDEDAEIALSSAVLKVNGSIPFVGYAVYYAAQPLGTLLLIWIPATLLVVLWLTDRVKAWRARHTKYAAA
ncbi:MAG: signal peptidase I [Chloroflexi bacterium]|nr:signal peptidase I [Chloroflexota bacterium]